MSDEYPLSKLIADLQTILSEHGDVEVEVEGCDCTRLAMGATWEEGTDYLGNSIPHHVLVESREGHATAPNDDTRLRPRARA